MKKIDEVNFKYLNKDIVLEIFGGDSEGAYEEKTYPYKEFIEKIKRPRFFNEISNEIAEDCFSQSDTKPSQDEILDFKNDIILTKLIFFEEDLIIHIIAEKFFRV